MFAQLTAGLDLHANALIVRAERQRVIASNIANADTPGYVARDIDFKQAMAAFTDGPRLAMTASDSPSPQSGQIPLGTLPGASIGNAAQLGYAVQTEPAMDNNSVDLDRERASFVDNAVRYESTLRFISGYSKTILSAIQGQ